MAMSKQVSSPIKHALYVILYSKIYSRNQHTTSDLVKKAKTTAPGIPKWSPTLVLTERYST